jgi:hypothetical protein
MGSLVLCGVGVKAMATPMNPVAVALQALQNARLFSIPVWKILPGTRSTSHFVLNDELWFRIASRVEEGLHACQLRSVDVQTDSRFS